MFGTSDSNVAFERSRSDVESVGIVEDIILHPLHGLDVKSPKESCERNEQSVAGKIGSRTYATTPAERAVAEFTWMRFSSLSERAETE